MDILREDLGYIFRIKAYLQKRPKLLYALLLLFGIWAAYYIVSPWYYLSPDQISAMSYRAGVLNLYIQQILAGGLPQIAALKDHNPAFYLYASYLGAVCEKTEAMQIFLFLQLGAAAFVLLLYPTLIYKLTNTILPAFASPFLLKIFVGWSLYEFKNDTYWSMAWIVVIGLPLIGIFWREEQGWAKWAAFMGVCLCMGLGNLPRMHSSIGILLLLLAGLIKEYIIPLKKTRNRKAVFQACSLLILTLLSYTLFTGLIPKAYLTVTGQEGKIADFGPWHTIYAGLGWEENEYGFRFNDEYVDGQAKKIDPSVVYCSPEYMDILRDEWFRLWREDTEYMLGTYYRKFKACLDLSIPSEYGYYNLKFVISIFLLSACILRYVFKRKKILVSWRQMLFAAFFCCLFSLVFPMMANQHIKYRVGFVTACGMLFVFGSLSIMQSMVGVVEDFCKKPTCFCGTHNESQNQS